MLIFFCENICNLLNKFYVPCLFKKNCLIRLEIFVCYDSILIPVFFEIQSRYEVILVKPDGSPNAHPLTDTKLTIPMTTGSLTYVNVIPPPESPTKEI